METTKYFTPNIEDIRVGYEGWYFNSCIDELGVPELNYARWEKTILNKGMVETILEYGVREFKSAYLTKEQIEAEGWEHKWYEKGIHSWVKGELVLTTFDDFQRIKINYETGYQLFDGECKDINTFRYICKLLNID